MQSKTTQSKPHEPDKSKRLHLQINPPASPNPTSSDSSGSSSDITSTTFPTESTSPPPTTHPSNTKINPTLILVISILAALSFVFLLIHLLLRFLSRRRRRLYHHHHHSSNSSPLHTHTTTTTSDSNALRRLFRLHDSGLDQSIIDALPVFLYREISTATNNKSKSKSSSAGAGAEAEEEEEEAFECAVCLSEFGREDKLRLIPACGHAFHLNCIDTWLMANSTCPLCRSTLAADAFYQTDGAAFGGYWFGREVLQEGNCNGGSSSERGNGGGGGGSSSGRRKQPTVVEEVEELGDRRRVYSVRLGKFRCVNGREEEGLSSREMEMDQGISDGIINSDDDDDDMGHHHRRIGGGNGGGGGVGGRRCYSMGTSYRYVLGDSELVVSLSSSPVASRGGDADVRRGGGGEVSRRGGESGNLEGGGEEGKRISRRSRGESFSVSKIWLWSRKNNDRHINIGAARGGGGVGSGLPFDG